jgi:hypothetical protein
MLCVWAEAWERAQRMPLYGRDIGHILPPLDRRLEGTSAWINEFSGLGSAPAGWAE